jgi:hypothetical protein
MGIVLSVLFAVDRHNMAVADLQALAQPSILQACTDIASQARGPYFGAVKEQCLVKFDQRYAVARKAGMVAN